MIRALLFDKSKYAILFILVIFFQSTVYGQKNKIQIGESMEQYVKENHIEKIEYVIHRLAESRPFLEQFLEEEEHHKIALTEVKRKDISIGNDVDIFVSHISEHQNFTMILVPLNIYSLAIYDTLLFSVLEVTDTWLKREFPYNDLKNDSIKSSLMSLKNHDMLSNHIYHQVLSTVKSSVGHLKLDLKEAYVSTNQIHEQIADLSKEERELIQHHWGLMKKAFTHEVGLNVEVNIYAFGLNDIEVDCKHQEGEFTHKITPSNIFQRHQFVEDKK